MAAVSRFLNLFSSTKNVIIGMIHVKALPGTPLNKHSLKEITRLACEEAELYKSCSVDGVLVENMHDVPYVRGAGPELTAAMCRICTEVRRTLPTMPCGVQILAANNQEALAVALAADLQFVRAESYVYSHVADEGLMNACAGPLLRYRRTIGADHILVLTDIKKKHCSHSLTADTSIQTTARAAEFFLSDGIIVTGEATGDAPLAEHVNEVARSVSLPVLLGSGVTSDNVHLYTQAHGFIVGSHFKKGGEWRGDLEETRIQRLVATVRGLRGLHQRAVS